MTPEKAVENKIRQAFEDAGGYINKIFASPNTNKGIPDLIGSLNGVYIALEIKRLKGGKPTPVQIKNLQAIANSGGLAFVTNDINLIDVLKQRVKHYDPTKQVIKSTKIQITHWHTNEQPSVKDTHAHWNAIQTPHSLQIIASR